MSQTETVTIVGSWCFRWRKRHCRNRRRRATTNAIVHHFFFRQGVRRSKGLGDTFSGAIIHAGIPSQESFFSTGIIIIDQPTGTVTTLFTIPVCIPAFHVMGACATIEPGRVIILLGKFVRMLRVVPSRAGCIIVDQPSVGTHAPGIGTVLDAFGAHVTVPTSAIAWVVFFLGNASFARFVDFPFAGTNDLAVGVFVTLVEVTALFTVVVLRLGFQMTLEPGPFGELFAQFTLVTNIVKHAANDLGTLWVRLTRVLRIADNSQQRKNRDFEQHVDKDDQRQESKQTTS